MISIVFAFLLRHPDWVLVISWVMFSSLVDALPPLPNDAPWAARWLVASAHALAGNLVRMLRALRPTTAAELPPTAEG